MGLARQGTIASCREENRGATDSSHRERAVERRAIARAKQGDSDALHFLYVRYAADVFTYVRSIVRDHHAAEDIAQNVFAKLPAALAKYEEREVAFTAWILRVARNAGLDYLRAHRQIPVEEVRVSEHGDHQTGLDRRQALLDALSDLPPEQREVVVLRHIGGFSPTEIATQLGKSEGSVHGLHHRGRAALKRALREAGSGPVTA
jgi:RNA polymerase sigma-70 factor (ECF subfamily)